MGKRPDDLAAADQIFHQLLLAARARTESPFNPVAFPSGEFTSINTSEASKRQKLELAGPFLRFARGPDEKQAFDVRRHRSSLTCKKQAVHH